MKPDLTHERWAFVSSEPAGRREIRFAMAAAILSVLVFAAIAPFAKTPLPQYPVFIPIYVTALVLSDLITAALLFGQFSVLRSVPVLVLAAGYLFTACITLAYSLVFPGMFSATGLLGSGPQSSSVMYMVWHAGFPLVVMVYAKCKPPTTVSQITSLTSKRSPHAAVVCVVAVVLASTWAATLLATAGAASLPEFLQGHQTTPLGYSVLWSIWLLALSALVVLFRRKPHGVLDVWLMVVMTVWLCDIALGALLNTGRYDLGWYAGRIYGVLAASALLVVLLMEDIRHFARLMQMSVDLRLANQSLAEVSRIDALTQVANRRRFDEYLSEQIAIAQRHRRPLSLVLCDIDHFKAFNDRYGHEAGDTRLKGVASVLAACCQRPSDVAARYGGEEFAIILPDTDTVGAVHIAEGIRKAVAGFEGYADEGTVRPRSTISCGVASWQSAMTAKSLIVEADLALYQAKGLGRNRVMPVPDATHDGTGWMQPRSSFAS
jgi:diguanylate cyclase (GGDEF)-like protein